MMIRRKSKELIQFFQKIDEFPKPGPHVKNLIKIYKKQARHVLMIFGVLIVSCLLEAVINFLVNYCDSNVVKDEERICKLFVMETDLPSVLVRSPLYGLLFVCNLIQLTLMGFLGFLSFIMIPVLVIKLSCQFRITADSFERRLKVGVYKTRSVESSINGEEDLESVIKQHQYTLEVATMMTKTFHTIILLKLVFLVMPIIVVAYCLSQFPIGSFDFLRFTALFLVLLIKLATFCFFGEQLADHSLMVYRAVYMNQWYRMDKEDKKMLLIVATRAIRPARLEVWPHFVPVSFETFVNVCQFSYSVYSVLMMTTNHIFNCNGGTQFAQHLPDYDDLPCLKGELRILSDSITLRPENTEKEFQDASCYEGKSIILID
ncbi:hypothetical protein J6590_064102 [Homalodisca vitripennis]|nr:hypothetical protein J6590_064102 [Homalodisca vitripennis]